jgi:hypothetical protein
MVLQKTLKRNTHKFSDVEWVASLLDIWGYQCIIENLGIQTGKEVEEIFQKKLGS